MDNVEVKRNLRNPALKQTIQTRGSILEPPTQFCSPCLKVFGYRSPGVEVAPGQAHNSALVALNLTLERVVCTLPSSIQTYRIALHFCSGTGAISQLWQGHAARKLGSVARPVSTQLERTPGTLQLERNFFSVQNAVYTGLERTREIGFPVSLSRYLELLTAVLEGDLPFKQSFLTAQLER